MGSPKIIDIDHVERTITLFTIYALLLSIRRIDFSNFADELRMRSTLTVETQLLSNEKFGNRSSENVPPNLNLLVSIFLSLLVSFSFSILCLDRFYTYSFTVTFERNSVDYIRFHFPHSVFYFALPSLYLYLLILFQFVLRPFMKSAKRR